MNSPRENYVKELERQIDLSKTIKSLMTSFESTIRLA